MKIFIGADHRGYGLKENLKKFLYENGFEYEDLGAYELDPLDDYPIYAERVAKKVSETLREGEESKAILLCGSGVGVDIAANKFEGIRSGLAVNSKQVEAARADDDINVLAIPSDYVDENEAKEMLKSFLETPFESSEKHKRRLEEIDEIERKIKNSKCK